MKYSIVTLFPEWFESPLKSGLMNKAQEANIVDFEFRNPRDYAIDKHKSVDDTPYGGGAGMLMMLDPLLQCIRNIDNTQETPRYIALSPDGKPFNQELAVELSQEKHLVLICGRYEGFDERLFHLMPIEKISVGDVILNGGEVAALAVIEATARLLPHFMGKEESAEEESFSEGLLEYPQYTKPEEYEGAKVPSVLLSGNHAKIKEYRKQKSLEHTLLNRPDLIAGATLTYSDLNCLREIQRLKYGKNLHIALLHHPVILKDKKVGTSSLTNLDIHDIARSSCTYGLAGFHIVTPIEDQKALLDTLKSYWVEGQGAQTNTDRATALSLVSHAYTLEQAIQTVEKNTGMKPMVVGTSANALLDAKGREVTQPCTFEYITKALHTKSVLLLFGTSHGIAENVLMACDAILPPLRGIDRYNHLSVRAAVAICLDRLLGDLG